MVADNDHLPQMELSYSRRIMKVWRGSLWIEGAYLLGARKSTIFNKSYETHALIQTFTLGARYTLPVFDWLVPRLRVGAGAHVGQLGMEPEGNSQAAVNDWSAAFSGAVLGGVELLMPQRWMPTKTKVGLVVEGGYSFCTALSFDLAPAQDDDLLLIPLQGAHLGELSLDGGLLRISFMVRF